MKYDLDRSVRISQDKSQCAFNYKQRGFINNLKCKKTSALSLAVNEIKLERSYGYVVNAVMNYNLQELAILTPREFSQAERRSVLLVLFFPVSLSCC